MSEPIPRKIDWTDVIKLAFARAEQAAKLEPTETRRQRLARVWIGQEERSQDDRKLAALRALNQQVLMIEAGIARPETRGKAVALKRATERKLLDLIGAAELTPPTSVARAMLVRHLFEATGLTAEDFADSSLFDVDLGEAIVEFEEAAAALEQG